jgi:hypothetical protein
VERSTQRRAGQAQIFDDLITLTTYQLISKHSRRVSQQIACNSESSS